MSMYNDSTPPEVDYEPPEPPEFMEPGQGRIGVEVHLPPPALGGDAVSLESVKKAYTELFGAAMTEKQTASLFQVAEKLGVRGDDGIWVLLMALENYQRLYMQAPWAVQSAVRSVLQEVREEASNAAKDAAQEVKKDIARIARKAAGTAGWRRYLPYSIPAVMAAGAWFLGYIQGQLTPQHSNLTIWIYKLFY